MCTSQVFAQQVPSTADTSGSADVAQSGNPFADVPTNSWAYQAVKALAADGLIEGYPNGKFEGNRPMTRYEMAVLVNRAVDKLEAQIAAGQKQNAADIATLKKLVDEFGKELKAVQDHVAALDTKVAAIDAAEKADATLLKRQQFHLYDFIRAPGSYQDAVSAYAPASAAGPITVTQASGATLTVPAGGALPANVRLTSGGTPGSPGGVSAANAEYTGSSTYGTAYMVNRLLFTGDVDSNVSYVFRIENRYYMETPGYGAVNSPTGNAGSAPVYCTGIAGQGNPLTGGAGTSTSACPVGTDYPSNTSFRLNIAALTWHTPGGFYVSGGRLVAFDGSSDLGGTPPNFLYSDYFNGGQIGWTANAGTPMAGAHIELGYGVGNPSVEGPGTTGTLGGFTQQDFYGQAYYDIIPHHLNIGAAYLAEIGNAVSLWDPAATILNDGKAIKNVTGSVFGLYCGVSFTAATTGCPAFFGTNMDYGSVFLTYRLTDYVHVNAEGVHHFGNDPFTGAAWAQPNSFWGDVVIGNNAGGKGTPWAEGGYIASGFNGLSAENNADGTTAYFPAFINNMAGYQIYYGGLHYKIANNAEIAIIGFKASVLSGVNIPASSAGCPGCFITADNRSAIYLQTLFSF
jgi:hypothetical protein